MATVQEIYNEIDRIETSKSGIAGAIEEKGVEVPVGAKIDEYPELVRQIQQGDTSDCVKFTPQTLTEEQKAQARDNIGAGSGGGSSDVFWATYGSTTYQDVLTAYLGGKVVYCIYQDRLYEAGYYIAASSQVRFFSHIGGSTAVIILNASGWSSGGAYTYEQSFNKVSTLSGNETSTTKYPNTKAVADAVAPLYGYQYIKDITPVSGTSIYKLADVADYEEVRVEITRPAALSTGTATTLWIAYTLNGTDGRLNTANANLLMKFCRAVIWKKGVLIGGEMSRGNTITAQTLVPNSDATLPDGAVATEYQLQFASDAAWDAGDTIKVYGLPRTK